MVLFDLDNDGRKIHRVYEIRNNDAVLFVVSEEIKLDHLDTIAKNAGARIVATGSFRYENKINNALFFPI